MTSMGHPASTWGSEIDYFVSGSEAETADHPERNYSDTGWYCCPAVVLSTSDPSYRRNPRSCGGPEVILNRPWNAQKMNHAFARTLRTLLER